jgi:hypothetical protein
MRRGRRISCLTLLALCACAEAPARPPPPPASIAPAPLLPRVPVGCEASLAGVYAHRDDPTFRYQIDDDGLNLSVHAFRQYGETRVELSTAANISLHRTATGIHGQATALVRNGVGSTCNVVFPYELTACEPSGLTLRTAQQVSLGDACQPQDAAHFSLQETALVRLPPTDGGTPDAGAPSSDAGGDGDGGGPSPKGG